MMTGVQAGYSCPLGSTSATQSVCPVGKFSLAAAGSCTDCPAGRFGSTIPMTVSTCTGGEQWSANYGRLYIQKKIRSVQCPMGCSTRRTRHGCQQRAHAPCTTPSTPLMARQSWRRTGRGGKTCRRRRTQDCTALPRTPVRWRRWTQQGRRTPPAPDKTDDTKK